MTDILFKDKNFLHSTPFICSQTSKEVLNYPHPYTKIEENPTLSAIDEILKIRIKAVDGSVCYLMQKE